MPSTTTEAAAPSSTWRGFSTTETNYIEVEFPDLIEGPSVWDGKELEKHPEKWIYYVTEEDIADIDQAAKHFLSLEIPLKELSAENFPLKTFNKVLAEQKNELFNGLGFSLIRGFPILNYDRKTQAVIFMGIGAHIGHRKAQNAKRHVLGHIKDLTYGSTTKGLYDANDPTTRIYATRKAQPFHVDGTDVVALLCLQKGAEGGISSVISSHTLYNRLRELRPDIVELLKKPWLWDRKNENAPGEPPYVAASPITYHKGRLFTFWGPHFLETVTRFPEVTVEPEKFEAIKYIQELCEREALNMTLEVGDIQFVQNYQILHARTAYRDTPEQTRHLLRLWLLVNAREVGWEIPFVKGDYNYDLGDEQNVPLEAE